MRIDVRGGADVLLAAQEQLLPERKAKWKRFGGEERHGAVHERAMVRPEIALDS